MPDYGSPNWGTLGEIADAYRQSSQRAKREQVLQSLGQGSGPLDFSSASRQLLAAGDTEGGLSLARLAQQQYLTSPEYITKAKTAEAEVQERFAPKTTNIKTAAGDEITVEKGPSGYRIPKIEGQSPDPNNPFAQGKMTEAQSKDALYTSRMLSAEQVLRNIDAETATSWIEKARGAVSDKLGYNVRSPEFQKFDQAQRDFINATLRRESGAVISESEFDNARKQYFPQPGDTVDVIKQKRANRAEAIKGIGAGAGPGYKPTLTIDARGELVPNPGAQKPQAQSLPRVASPADAAKLPKGTRFLDPNGVERIVP